jgi:UPF0042 nucleotide-binding protein
VTGDLELLVIVSGLSGSGKSTAINILEDMGYYSADNLPLVMLPGFVDLIRRSGEGRRRVVVGVDAREREFLADFPAIHRELSGAMPTQVVYLESSEQALARRFSETRRRHPLAQGSLREAIAGEKVLLAPIRGAADVIVDTTDLSIHDLKRMIQSRFESSPGKGLNVALVSFGYKYGIPCDADLLFDVRFLPNPHFIPGLRNLTGRNRRVRRFLREGPHHGEFMGRLEGMMAFLLPLYAQEGKSHLTVAVGCTGGRHRSVAVVEELEAMLLARGTTVVVEHRDIGREGK